MNKFSNERFFGIGATLPQRSDVNPLNFPYTPHPRNVLEERRVTIVLPDSME